MGDIVGMGLRELSVQEEVNWKTLEKINDKGIENTFKQTREFVSMKKRMQNLLKAISEFLH